MFMVKRGSIYSVFHQLRFYSKSEHKMICNLKSDSHFLDISHKAFNDFILDDFEFAFLTVTVSHIMKMYIIKFRFTVWNHYTNSMLQTVIQYIISLSLWRDWTPKIDNRIYNCLLVINRNWKYDVQTSMALVN